MNISRDTAYDLLGLLDDLETYFDKRSDVVDGSYGIPEPNEAMQFLSRIKEAWQYLASEMGVQDDPS